MTSSSSKFISFKLFLSINTTSFENLSLAFFVTMVDVFVALCHHKMFSDMILQKRLLKV